MINIIYTILLFNILIIGFKMFQKYKVDNLQALIANYLTGAVCSYLFLETNFSNILNATFTSTMETNLDEIANNNVIWNNVLDEFYSAFIINVDSLNNKDSVITYKNDKRRLLGKNEDNLSVYSYS